MAIQAMDGFSTGAGVAELGFSGSAGPSTNPSGGRFGGGYIVCSAANGTLSRAVPITRTKLGTHFAFILSGSVTAQVMSFNDSGGNTHVQLALGTGNVLVVKYGNSLASQASTGVTISPNVWYGVEVWLEISDTVGVIKVWVNGASTANVNLSGIDNRNGGNGDIATQSTFSSAGGGSFSAFCDWVIYDDQSPATTAPIGDVRVQSLFPNGNGNSSVLAGSDGNSVNNYQLVDETPYNGDTDYVESATVGDKDTYAFDNLTSTTGTVLAVQARLVAEKTDAGTREYKAVYRSGATEVDGAVDTLLSSYHISGYDIQEAKPGGGAWSISDVNAAEFGAKVTA